MSALFSACDRELTLNRPLGVHIELTAATINRLAAMKLTEGVDIEGAVIKIVAEVCHRGKVEITRLRWER